MTPFGLKMRALRKERGISQKQMAKDLGISPAYLSALEHGWRGKATTNRILQICDYFDLIWDDVEDIKNLSLVSKPRVTIDTQGLSGDATKLVNLLSYKIGYLDKDKIKRLISIIE